MPQDMDSGKVVESAIARELVDFDRRLAADQRGFWKGTAERIRQGSATGGWPFLVFILFITCFMVLVWLFAAVYGLDTRPPSLVVAAILAVGGVAATSLRDYFSRRERKSTKPGSLNRERAAAEVRTVFPRVKLQQILKDGGFVAEFDSDNFWVANRLTSMGVFKEFPLGGGGGMFYSLTDAGREILESVLADMDRQHVEKWANIAKENSEGTPIGEGDAGDDGA